MLKWIMKATEIYDEGAYKRLTTYDVLPVEELSNKFLHKNTENEQFREDFGEMIIILSCK